MGPYIQHISARVPWHDSGWDGTVCKVPHDNTSCVLLRSIGLHRDDAAEVASAGEPMENVAFGLPPCVAERGTFLSPRVFTLIRKHPYDWKLTTITEATLQVPAWSFHAIPYFWLTRQNIDELQGQQPIVGYVEDAEVDAAQRIGFDAKHQTWVLHGDNQRALIDAFFTNVAPESSLVFFYAKHSPFDGSRRLLVGAAVISQIIKPGRWPGSDASVFPSHMWETTITHTLRPDGTGGILLPVQALAGLAATGADVSAALAEAPETDREFSYVTEHVAPDTAVASLMVLQRAAQEAGDLGHPVPAASLAWLDEQLRLAWIRRGVAPGLPAVLSALAFEQPTFAARTITSAVTEGEDPWPALEGALNGDPSAPVEIARLVTGTKQRVWAKLDPERRAVLRLLSRFDLTPSQVNALLEVDGTPIALSDAELLENPYNAVTCTLGGPDPIAFDVIDRGCFPGDGTTVVHPLPVTVPFDDHVDARRVEAAIAGELALADEQGSALLPLEQVLERMLARTLTRPLPLNAMILSGLDLDPESLGSDDSTVNWPVLCRIDLADGRAAYKLRSSAARGRVIRSMLDLLTRNARHACPTDLDATLAGVLGSLDGHDPDDLDAEQRAREEKLAALEEMYASRFTVLNGRAGTGKTTLIRALVGRTELAAGGILLLAPTGKAAVQLKAKSGADAKTIAQFLAGSSRYDGDTGRYLVTGNPGTRTRASLVVIDEASMLTEDMLAAVCDALLPPDRLILVGDPRQLPPIGPGRPFVDIERAARDRHDGTWPLVAPGWAALTVLRRQKGRVRDDLMLAHWFSGDEIPEGFDEVWHRLRDGVAMPSVATYLWNGRTPEQVLDAVLQAELGVQTNDHGHSFATSYGADIKDGYVNYFNAAARCEKWQALSPFRGRAYGTVNLNRHLKDEFRGEELARALVNSWTRRVPPPLGAERITLGDKVVNLVNHRARSWNKVDGNQTGYIANGEIGVVIGQISSKSPPKSTQIEYSSQPTRRYNASLYGEDDAPIELAWALTVHKAQGSEFNLVILMLPAGIRQLSRELLYTALTRQVDRVVLCHEGPLDNFLDLTRASGSDTGRRLTDLIRPPAPRAVTTASGQSAGILDAGLVHVTDGGVLVRSKNEVIVADILDQLAPGAWAYEQPITGADGTTRLPDFTISTADGRTVYWEHLGMLDDGGYAAAWDKKLGWYAANGILPATSGGGPNGTLIWTDDRTGVNKPQWRAMAEPILGSPRASTPARSAKKTAKPRK